MTDLFEDLRKEKDKYNRNHIARKILGFARGKEVLVVPTIEALEKEKYDFVRCTLLEILSRIGTNSAVDGIIPRLKDKSNLVVNRAVKYMCEIKTLATSKVLREIVLKTKDEKHLSEALFSLLKRIDDPNLESESEVNLNFVIETLMKSKLKSLVYLISRLGELSEKAYKEKIIATLKDMSQNHKSPDFRQEASKFLDSLEKLSNEIKIKIGGSQYKIYEDGRLMIDYLGAGLLSGVKRSNHASKVKHLRIQKGHFKSLDGIEALTNLEILNVGKIGFLERKITTKIPLEDISALSNCPNLRHVDLSMCNIKDLNALANHPHLAVINLSDNEIEKIEGLINLPNLTDLNLSTNKIKEISGLDDLTNLRQLDLSYNKISQIKGLQNLNSLLTIKLNGNVGLLESREKNAQKLVAQCAGISLGPEISIKYKEPNIHVFKHILVKENDEDHCLYCKNPVPAGENQQALCQKSLEKIILSKNSKIPSKKTERKIVGPAESRVVTGYKSTPNPYSSFTTKVVRMGPKTEKTKKHIGNLNGKVFFALPGTVCKECSDKYLEGANKILSSIILKGSAEKIQKSLYDIENSFYSHTINWMRKI